MPTSHTRLELDQGLKVTHQTIFRCREDGDQNVTNHTFVCLNFTLLSDQQVIWVFGSSIIKRAFVASFLRPGGSDLNLDRLNITLWWQGYGGLEILVVNAIQKLQVLKQVGPLPSAIFIHCGGNDLGKTSVRKIRLAIITILQYLGWEFPNVHIIWSLILPRLKWRYSENTRAMEEARKCINSFISNKVCEVRGSVVQCPDISDHPHFLSKRWGTRGLKKFFVTVYQPTCSHNISNSHLAGQAKGMPL